MTLVDCEKCGDDSTSAFYDYDTGEWSSLCWPCRKPEVLRRARQGTPSNEHPGGANTPSDPPESGTEDPPPESGQMDITGY